MSRFAGSSRTFFSEIASFPFIHSEEYDDCQYGVVPTQDSLLTLQQFYPPLLYDADTHVNTVKKTNNILVLLQK